MRFLKELLAQCPFPIHCIQTDNGAEFTFRLNPLAGHVEHRMDTWCKQQGIEHRLIPPGVKELNGKVERSHRIDMQYFYWRAPSHDLARFNHELGRWIWQYNTNRPHGGLGYLTPMEKLKERSQTLQCPSLTETLEVLRLKFLSGLPKQLSTQDRQIQELEHDLLALLKLTA